MPSDDYNYDEAIEVLDGVRTIDECEDPDAVIDILDDEYHPHRFDDVDDSYTFQEFDENIRGNVNKDVSSSICSLLVLLFSVAAFLIF